MASIEARTNQDGSTSFRVSIRRKKKELYATFSDLETAKIWAHYKECLIDNMESFSVPKEDLISLEDLKELKFKESIKNKKNGKYMADCNSYMDFWISAFGENRSIKSLSYNEILKHCEEFLNIPRQKGGVAGNVNTGIVKKPSVETIVRRLAALSASIGIAIRNGCNIENYPLRIINVLRERVKKDV